MRALATTSAYYPFLSLTLFPLFLILRCKQKSNNPSFPRYFVVFYKCRNRYQYNYRLLPSQHSTLSPSPAPLHSLFMQSQWRRLRILHALIDPHELLSRCLGQRDELRQILHCRWVEIMHHHKIPSFRKIPIERIQLLFRRCGERPEIIFDVDAPVDEFGAGDYGRETLPDACAFGAEWGAEIFACIYISSGSEIMGAGGMGAYS